MFSRMTAGYNAEQRLYNGNGYDPRGTGDEENPYDLPDGYTPDNIIFRRRRQVGYSLFPRSFGNGFRNLNTPDWNARTRFLRHSKGPNNNQVSIQSFTWSDFTYCF